MYLLVMKDYMTTYTIVGPHNLKMKPRRLEAIGPCAAASSVQHQFYEWAYDLNFKAAGGTVFHFDMFAGDLRDAPGVYIGTLRVDTESGGLLWTSDRPEHLPGPDGWFDRITAEHMRRTLGNHPS